jgi:hypothetical protein
MQARHHRGMDAVVACDRYRWSGWPWTASIAALLFFGVLRAAALLAHQPLLAYANSYDEVRYSACFGLYPDRPRDIPPADNSPWAPFERYVELPAPEPMCYWSTEWLPDAIVALGHRAARGLRLGEGVNVRWLGAVKLTTIVALVLGFTLAWWRRGQPRAALANAALLPLVLADPANTLYLSTFYAEATALAAWYALVSLILLHSDRPASTAARIALALAALALGLSKIQHLVLPLAIGLSVLGLDYALRARGRWRGAAILAGALVALAMQVAQLSRPEPLIANIREANAADVVLTGILPASSDPAATAARLGLGAGCLTVIGKRAWELPDYAPDRACPGLARFSRARQLVVLATEPMSSLRFARNGVDALDSWLAKGLGAVAGGATEPLPQEFASLGRPLLDLPALRLAVFAFPIVAAIVLLLRARARRFGGLARDAAVLASVTIGATFAVTILGDGLADTAKQGHLVFNAALSFGAALATVGAAAAIEQLARAWGAGAPRLASAAANA